MKGKKILAGIISAAMVLGTMAFPVFADDTNWADRANIEWYSDSTASEYTLSTAEDLAGLASLVNGGTSFEKKIIKLGNDIDLEGIEWTPIGKSGSNFKGTFDGNGNTIKNLSITGWGSDVGLFGFTTVGEIKDFTLENASVSGYLDVGAVAGTPYTSKYSNITVQGLIQVDGYAYVGGAFGKNGYANLTNVDVYGNEGSYVKANSENYRTYIGGLIGFMGEGNQTIKDCDVAINVSGSTCDIGGITGILHYGNKMINCTYRGSLALTNPTDSKDMTEIGGLAGTYLTNSGHVTLIDNCKTDVESVMLTDLQGTTKEIKDEITSIGNAYSEEHKTNGECSVSATVNGKEETFTTIAAIVKKDNTDTKFIKFADAVAAVQNGGTITLCNDVTTAEQIKFNENVTLDLNGCTLTSDYSLKDENGKDKSGNDRYAVVFENGGTFTDSAADGAKGALVANLARALTANGELTVENSAVKCTDTVPSGNAVIGTTAGLNMKNSTVIGEFEGSYAVSSFGTTGTEKYTIENSVINAKTVGIYRNGSAGNFEMSVKDSEITATSADQNLAVYISNNSNFDKHKVTFENCVISGETGIEAKYSDLTLTKCNVTATGTPSYEQNNNGATARGFAVVITDNAVGDAKANPVGSIKIDGGDYTGMIGLENCADAKKHMDNDTKTTAVISGGSFSTDVSDYCKDGFKAKFVNGKYVVDEDDSTDTVALKFEKSADADNVYNIVLNGDGKDINRLNAAEFKFNLNTADKITYEIKAADKLTTLQPDADKYVFYFDGKDAINNADSGADITIGTVTFNGYGTFIFEATEGKVTATTASDNLVTEFVTTGDTGKGTLKISEDANKITDGKITVPTHTLTINVLMNHPVEKNAADYQDMTVAISGGDLAGKVLTYKLGDADAEINETTKTVAQAANGSYEITEKLTENRIYTVTVSGAGYRTARYTVNMSADKTMNVWNNVMDTDTIVVDTTTARKNFLAGDIIRDGIINIYDLSAVVAYFGTDKLPTSNPTYAKYDLNRDGVIDMMDISIVLTSWGE